MVKMTCCMSGAADSTVSFALVALFLFATPLVIAATTPIEHRSGPSLPDQECKMFPEQLADWTEPEQWAWKQISEGRIADFNRRHAPNGEVRNLDPNMREHDSQWASDRELRPGFLATILLVEPYRSAIPRRGVRIVGAYFPAASGPPCNNSKSIDLIDAQILSPLLINYSRMDSNVHLSRLKTPSFISLSNSKVYGTLDMYGASVDGDVYLQHAEFRDVDMSRMIVGRALSMDYSKVIDGLQMASISIGSDLLMRKAQFRGITLRAANIGGQLNLDESIVEGPFDLDSASVGVSLHMQKAEFYDDVHILGTRIESQLSMNKSVFKKTVYMDSLTIGVSLYMSEAEFGDLVDMGGTKVSEQIGIVASEFSGKLNMNSIFAGESIIMKDSVFHEVNIVRGKVTESFNMDRSHFKASLLMGGISIGGNLRAHETRFKDLNLLGAEVTGQIDMIKAELFGYFAMESGSIGRDLIIRQAESHGLINLAFTSIGAHFDTRGARLTALDLTGARLDGDLILKADDDLPEVRWSPHKTTDGTTLKPKLTLRNTKIDGLQDSVDSWPSHLDYELDGLTYERIGTTAGDNRENTYGRGRSWFRGWLDRDKGYSPQPYRQLAMVLRSAGYTDMANSILFDGRERERGEIGPLAARWWLLSILKVVIGYGYGWRYFIALGWLVVLVAIGVMALRLSKERDKWPPRIAFWYSLDMVIPVIRLRERHYTEIDLDGFPKYWFGVQQIMGYVLVFFVVAGLSGLTELK